MSKKYDLTPEERHSEYKIKELLKKSADAFEIFVSIMEHGLPGEKKDNDGLKLFVWADFRFVRKSSKHVHYDGLAFAIAESEEEAKEIIRASYTYPPSKFIWGEVEILPISKVARLF